MNGDSIAQVKNFTIPCDLGEKYFRYHSDAENEAMCERFSADNAAVSVKFGEIFLRFLKVNYAQLTGFLNFPL